MKFPFWKMHGAKNDFLLFDDRNEEFPVRAREWINRIAARRSGIGCDGIILIQESAQADFRMRFINPDGGEVTMCGNGARCVALLAFEQDIAGRTQVIETGAGVIGATIKDASVVIEMPSPHSMVLGGEIAVDGDSVPCHVIDTGVPHAVVTQEALEACDIVRLGRLIRNHERFSPDGTNVNFVVCHPNSAMSVRTYERGVEDETAACGTGIVASAIIAAHLGEVQPPVTVSTRGNDRLHVDFVLTPTGATNVTLEGPAEHVFQGVVAGPGPD